MVCYVCLCVSIYRWMAVQYLCIYAYLCVCVCVCLCVCVCVCVLVYVLIGVLLSVFVCVSCVSLCVSMDIYLCTFLTWFVGVYWCIWTCICLGAIYHFIVNLLSSCIIPFMVWYKTTTFLILSISFYLVFCCLLLLLENLTFLRFIYSIYLSLWVQCQKENNSILSLLQCQKGILQN